MCRWMVQTRVRIHAYSLIRTQFNRKTMNGTTSRTYNRQLHYTTNNKSYNIFTTILTILYLYFWELHNSTASQNIMYVCGCCFLSRFFVIRVNSSALYCCFQCVSICTYTVGHNDFGHLNLGVDLEFEWILAFLAHPIFCCCKNEV